MIDRHLNAARVLKHLVYILEQKGFVLRYDRRFERLKPKLDNKHDYLHHEYLNNPYSSLTYLRFRDQNFKYDYELDYDDSFFGSFNYSKYAYPTPQNPRRLDLAVDYNSYKDYTSTEAEALAQAIFDELMNAPTQTLEPDDKLVTKYRKELRVTP